MHRLRIAAATLWTVAIAGIALPDGYANLNRVIVGAAITITIASIGSRTRAAFRREVRHLGNIVEVGNIVQDAPTQPQRLAKVHHLTPPCPTEGACPASPSHMTQPKRRPS